MLPWEKGIPVNAVRTADLSQRLGKGDLGRLERTSTNSTLTVH